MHACVRIFTGLTTLLIFAGTSHAMPATSPDGMVVTAHPDATRAGNAMLRAGGTACDAAVAATFALSVLEPPCSGLGGGGMALVRAQGDAPIALLDFREVAPMAATADMFLRNGAVDWELANDGAQAVAVPGTVAGLVALHAHCGKLPLAQVIKPAIDAARDGFDVDLRYHRIATFRTENLRRDAESARLFLRPDADGLWDAPTPGARIVQEDLARTLTSIGADGGEAFYRGPIAEAISVFLQAQGGLITREDLAAYTPHWREPLVGTFRDHTIVTAPLPSRGGMHLLTILNFLETCEADAGWHSLPWLARYLAGSKVALADAWILGDPDFMTDAPARMGTLTSKARARKLAAGSAVAAPRVMPPPGAGTYLAPCNEMGRVAHPLQGGTHTTHVVATDAQGGVVSLTQSLNAYWGAARVVPTTGVLLNNQMNDFELSAETNLPCGPAVNTIAPGKTPMSHMTPTIVLDAAGHGQLRAVLGSPGGRRIPGIVAQAVAALLEDNVDLDVAFALRRIDYNPVAGTIESERYALEAQTMSALSDAGYVFEPRIDWGNAVGVTKDPQTGIFYGAADVRGVGSAAGP